MKKKALVLLFVLFAIPIITVVPAFAGKGQEKLSFVLTLNGGVVGLENPPRVTDGITHYDGLLWHTTDNTPANLLLEIDGAAVAIVDLALRRTGKYSSGVIFAMVKPSPSSLIKSPAPNPRAATLSLVVPMS